MVQSVSVRYVTAGSEPQFTAHIKSLYSYYPSPCPHNKHSNVQLQLLSLCRLQQLAMPSRLTVVSVSLLLATPAVIFWLWLMILPARVAMLCPEECRCETEGYYVNCSGSVLKSIPLIHPTDVRMLVIDGNNITF